TSTPRPSPRQCSSRPPRPARSPTTSQPLPAKRSRSRPCSTRWQAPLRKAGRRPKPCSQPPNPSTRPPQACGRKSATSSRRSRPDAIRRLQAWHTRALWGRISLAAGGPDAADSRPTIIKAGPTDHAWSAFREPFMTKTGLCSSVAAIAVATLLAATPGAVRAQQADPAIQVGDGDLGGVVTGPNGPEAGVWVIAETTDLPTKFAKVVVTDDRGRYVIPELPKANYSVWVRGY